MKIFFAHLVAMACAMWQSIPAALGADATAEEKSKQYKLVARAMRKFFEKYDISAAGRMATVRCV